MDKTNLYFSSHVRENMFLQEHVVNDLLGKNRVMRENITESWEQGMGWEESSMAS